MISETTFAKKFTSFWNELLPNAKHFVRLINSAQVESTHKPLPSAPRKGNVALLNILGFELYRHYIETGEQFDAISVAQAAVSAQFPSCMARALASLQRFGQQPIELPLRNDEIFQTAQISQLLSSRYSRSKHPKVTPQFDGCGFVNPAEGDIIVDSKLVEIKSGERAFSAADFRQIIIYCTLNHFSRQSAAINIIELFNPRMGIRYEQNMEEMIHDLSSLPALDVFGEIQRFATESAFSEASAGSFQPPQ